MAFVLIEKPHPHVTLITLNRPERMNAMAFDVMIPFREALEQVSVDNDCRVAVITGARHHEGRAQLYVRLTTENFEEAARRPQGATGARLP
ncbi:MAG TPA: enoyl-CoA hydratase-related protein [Acidimicrobiales bacterium]